MSRATGRALAGVLLAWFFSAAQAQVVPAPGIYTCVDARGRALTADRPIAECLDREQRVLNPSGTVRTTVEPALTAQEQREKEAHELAEVQARARQADARGRDRALLMRYPNQARHDQERAQALRQIDGVLRAARLRVTELTRQRAAMDNELEFYRKDPGKVPPALRRQVEENTQSLAGQKRFVAEQEAESQRVNARFEEELLRLQKLWAPQEPAGKSRNTSK